MIVQSERADRHDVVVEAVNALTEDQLRGIVGCLVLCMMDGRVLDSPTGWELDEQWVRRNRTAYNRRMHIPFHDWMPHPPLWNVLAPVKHLLPGGDMITPPSHSDNRSWRAYAKALDLAGYRETEE